MRHLFISAHLDDTALSCGGTAHQLAAGGQSVWSATLCTGDTPPTWLASPAARRVHEEWQLGDNPYVARRQEDLSACKVLGIKPIHLGLPDAVYRFNPAGAPLYTDDFMSGKLVYQDLSRTLEETARALRMMLYEQIGLGDLQLYCPLTLGGHVDHVLLRHAIESLQCVLNLHILYYEDYPYGERDLAQNNPVTRTMSPQIHALGAEDLDARIAAIQCYPSQLQPVFHLPPGPELNAAVAARVRAYASTIGGERYWRKPSATRH